MRVGMQGIYARILWTQLLQQVRRFRDIGYTQPRDPVFPCVVDDDEAVQKELEELLGRSTREAKEIYDAFASCLIQTSRHLIQLASSKRASEHRDASMISIVFAATGADVPESFSTWEDSAEHMVDMRFGESTLNLRGDYLLKLLRLYRLHTARDTSLLDHTFLRRAFCVVQRYETLSGSSEGYQVTLSSKHEDDWIMR